MTVQVERNGAVAQVETGDHEGEGNEEGEGATGQAKVLDESLVDVHLLFPGSPEEKSVGSHYL